MESLKTWWRQYWCHHFNQETTITLSYGPVLTKEAVCRDCGKTVPSNVSVGDMWVHNQLKLGENMAEGEEEIVFKA